MLIYVIFLCFINIYIYIYMLFQKILPLGETKEAVEAAKAKIRTTASLEEKKTVLESIYADQKMR